MLSFSFNFKPYIAVIGDIVASKKISDRRAVQEKLGAVLSGINKKYSGDLASRFMLTLGDEFQGLLEAGGHALAIVDKIEREMHPVMMRFGIGVGRITTAIDRHFPLGADGPAYYYARKMIDELKTAEKRNKEAKQNIKIAIEEHAALSELLNTIFALCTALKARWTGRQREVINAYLDYREIQSDAAQKLGIHQSSVQRALANANFYTYQKALLVVSEILSEIKE
ncbi:MAG: hypothetical protein GX044_06175 [Firmicutes bacterium]|jgi:hypothetical protein|nr:hypothetical protein [Bacillota bacterium]